MSNCKHFPNADDHCLVCEEAERKRIADPREALADEVVKGIYAACDASIERGHTTSGCPLLTVSLGGPDLFHITVTRAR